MIASTLTSAGELFSSGSYTNALFEELNREGTGSIDFPMLNEAKNRFTQTLPQIPLIFAQRLKEGDVALVQLREENERRSRAYNIVNNVVMINVLFVNKRGAILFRQDEPRVFSELYNPCPDEAGFAVKIASLEGLFEVDRTSLQQLVSRPNDMGSITLVRTWMDEEQLTYDPAIIETWENMITLRNCYPTHLRTAGRVESLQFFGETVPPNYSNLWDNILNRFLQTLLSFERTLSQL